MANLLDTLRQNSQVGQQGVTDETSKLATLLRAKSGKAVGGSGVVSSNLGEQAAVAQTNQQLQQQVAPQAAIQQAGMAQQASQIQQQETQQRADIAQSRRFDTVQNKIKTDQLLKDLERNKGEIDVAKQGAQLEQLGANLRLQNKKYVDDLQREGQLARLNDDAAFREAALRSAMGNKMEIVNKTIDNNTILSANDREFKKKVAQIDIATAYNMFNADMAAGKQQAMWGGIGSLAKAGIAAYGAYSSQPSTATASDIDASAGGQAASNSSASTYKDYV